MYDIVIVGAGPAGSTLARLIGDKYKLLLIDKRDLENENPKNHINKCCGGLLAPDAQKMIAKLGLGIPKDILVDPQPFAVRAIDLTNNLERLYQRFYFNMDRSKFDRWLVSIIPNGVDKKFNSHFKSFAEVSGGYEIKYIHNGKEISAKTRIIVGADGASSRIRNFIDKDVNIPEKYISIQQWFECPCPMQYFTAIFDEEISDFYSWIIPKENYLLLGSALRPRDNTRKKYEILKTKLTQLGFNFDNTIKTEGAYIYRPKKISQLCAGRNGIALVGEAAGAISPSSAEGISYALKSSLYLAQSLEEEIDGFLDRYKHRVKHIKLNLLIKNLKSPAMYNPFLRHLAMKSGLLSI
ncbi:MAG: FAD-binding protein [Clostridium sp.]|uniref:FAD-binding protein n=1 Tax=Clostridium sp. TaxID=1506 RepID=UPI0025BA082D|nr:FAD-binding protein [Clostridium sp.]MCH3964469.1 FAD-binding protein [Clostridium sp.]MCI1715643.1 FAD-binding protein [Clostridium sp.]MCI1799564.1 FAD-binding protein [Clostridium sp.]MCI1813827.1 FAD-binding protein [Clostridium sp.]MCI1870376.1 FAD-binding protein [Clostridium sp.]